MGRIGDIVHPPLPRFALPTLLETFRRLASALPRDVSRGLQNRRFLALRVALLAWEGSDLAAWGRLNFRAYLKVQGARVDRRVERA